MSSTTEKVVVLCPHCKAPSSIPTSVEQEIWIYKSFECWECKKEVPLTQDLKHYIYATRSDLF